MNQEPQTSMLNQIWMEGIVDKPVEQRSTHSGKQVTSFVVANLTQNFKDPQRPFTGWFRVDDWKNHQVDQGDHVLIEGRIKTESYEAKDGSKRYITKIVANKIFVLANKENISNEFQNETEQAFLQRSSKDGYTMPDQQYKNKMKNIFGNQYDTQKKVGGTEASRTFAKPQQTNKISQKEINKIEDTFKKDTESLFSEDDIPF